MKTIQITDEGLVAYTEYLVGYLSYQMLQRLGHAEAEDYMEMNALATKVEELLDLEQYMLPR